MQTEVCEYPKYVIPHESHVVRKDGRVVSVPAFPGFHVSRVDGEVTVMVADADEEAVAKGLKEEPKEEGTE